MSAVPAPTAMLKEESRQRGGQRPRPDPGAAKAVPELDKALNTTDSDDVKRQAEAASARMPTRQCPVSGARSWKTSGPALQAVAAHALASMGKKCDAVPELTERHQPRASRAIDGGSALWKLDNRSEEVAGGPPGHPRTQELLLSRKRQRRHSLVAIGHPAFMALPGASRPGRTTARDEVRNAVESALETIGRPDKEDVDTLVKGLKSPSISAIVWSAPGRWGWWVRMRKRPSRR